MQKNLEVSNIDGNDFKEANKKIIKDTGVELKNLSTSIEYTQAKGKLMKFMSTDTINNQEFDENLLNGYHFETINRGINIKPQPEMVVKEVKSLGNRFQEKIDGYLKSNPAKIKELQIQLNDWINYGMVIEDKNSPTGRYTVHPIDVKILKAILEGTGMELEDNGEGSKRRYTIKEDGKLGPQTFAAICCFKKEFRRTTTTNSNRRPQQRH